MDKEPLVVVVVHGGYGCDTGCCCHYVELPSGEEIGVRLEHPYGAPDLKAWATQLAKQVVLEAYGPGHVVDLDWENSFIVDD